MKNIILKIENLEIQAYFKVGETMIIKLKNIENINFRGFQNYKLQDGYTYIIYKIPMNIDSSLATEENLREQSGTYFNKNYENLLKRVNDKYKLTLNYSLNGKEDNINIYYDVFGNIIKNINYTFENANYEKIKL